MARYIDADILLDKLYDHEFITLCPLDEVSDVIDYCPTVDAEPVRHGRWIERTEPISWCEDDVDVFYECSLCKCVEPGKTNYCPNCGVKMDGEVQ